MASLSTNSKGLRRILFVDGSGERRCVHLGRLPQKAAEAFLRRVEELNANRIAGVSSSSELASWLRALPEPAYAKLVRVGLVEQRAAASVRTVGFSADMGAGAAQASRLQTRKSWNAGFWKRLHRLSRPRSTICNRYHPGLVHPDGDRGEHRCVGD